MGKFQSQPKINKKAKNRENRKEEREELVASAIVGLSCDLVAVGGGRSSGSRPWLSLVLREQDDRGRLQEKITLMIEAER